MNVNPVSEAPLLTIMSHDDARPASLMIQGLRLLHVHTLGAASSVLASRRVSGVVIDFALPNQDTLGFVSALRGHPATTRIAIIAVGIGTATSRDMAREHGVDIVLNSLCRTPGVFVEHVSALFAPRSPTNRRPGHFPATQEAWPNESGIFLGASKNARSQHLENHEKRRAPEGVRLDAFSRSYAAL